MTFTESISACFSKYATFSGRASRSEFWWFALFLALVDLALSFVSVAMSNLWNLATVLPYAAVASRRLHDINRTGLWTFAPLIPMAVLIYGLATRPSWQDNGPVFYGSLIALAGLALTDIIFWASKGTEGSNRFGECPSQ